jgi:TolB-like protein/DNA-binding winged helix-turn-helix (wHTH) protein/tetratricopeptide (TPR) repeat protein
MFSRTPNHRRFGPFDVDFRTGELRKNGLRLKVQLLPLRILEILLEDPGHMVTREELQKRLWPEDTFVDFEHGLNSGINKLRQALGDSAAEPKYIETLERRGYRFIGSVEEVADDAPPPGPSLESPRPSAVETGAADAERTPVRIRALHVVTGFAVVGLTALIAWMAVRALERQRQENLASGIRSIAVLPFKNLSRDPEQESFADGMTDGVISQLARIGSLRVISATSTMPYKKETGKRLPEIARELNVDAVVEGTVIRDGGRVRITTQLIHAATDEHLWVEQYDRDASDVLTVQREVARAVAREIHVLLSSEETLGLAAKSTVNPAAHEAYVKGRSVWFSRWLGGPNELETSGKYFAQAISLDPKYAPAYAGLADYYAFLAIYGLRPPGEVWPKALEAIDRALELDPRSGEAMNSLAASRLYWKWDVNGADEASRRAIALHPNYSEAHSFRATLLAVMGRFDESIQEARTAEALDPVGQNGRVLLALYRARRYDDVVRMASARAAMEPRIAHAFLRDVALIRGDMATAWHHRLQVLPFTHDGERIERIKAAYAQGGVPATWRWEIEALRQRAQTQYVSPFKFAQLHARLGETKTALAELQRALDEHSDLMVFLTTEQDFDSVRDTPEFRDIVQQVGLPAIRFDHGR